MYFSQSDRWQRFRAQGKPTHGCHSADLSHSHHSAVCRYHSLQERARELKAEESKIGQLQREIKRSYKCPTHLIESNTGNACCEHVMRAHGRVAG